MPSSTDSMQACIASCTNCHKTCVETIASCLEKGAEHASADHITLLQDCADSCGFALDFMLRESTFHTETCGVCSKICEACAQSCEKMGGDAEMQSCAKAYRKCAKTCKDMTESMAA